MTKKEYIRRQIAKTNKKDYENYVITRIIHKIDDLDVKFITQQYVKRPDCRAMADLYFPQINFFVEIDEAHHLTQKETDKLRDADFENITGVEPRRIIISNNTIDKINDEVDNVVIEIKNKISEKKRAGKFIPWDIEKEMNPDTWIEKGTIHVNDKVAFRRIVDGCKVVGLNYQGYQRAGAIHPYEKDTSIWFPKLYPNGQWDNDYDELKGIIREKNIENREKRKGHINHFLNNERHKRIVFARVKSVFGDTLYRFRGIFQLDKEATSYDEGLIFRKISDEIKTYDYK